MNPEPPINIDEAMAKFNDMRTDPSLTAARHDEIIHLRLFLFDLADILEHSDDSAAKAARAMIIKRSQKWGKDKIV